MSNGAVPTPFVSLPRLRDPFADDEERSGVHPTINALLGPSTGAEARSKSSGDVLTVVTLMTLPFFAGQEPARVLRVLERAFDIYGPPANSGRFPKVKAGPRHTTSLQAHYVRHARKRIEELFDEERRAGSPEWELLQSVLDRASQLASTSVAHAEATAPLLVHRDGAWFRLPDGTLCTCSKRPVLKRLLLALVRARMDQPGIPVSRDALREAAWPGERMLPRSARNRIKQLISTLRRVGLMSILQSSRDGYLLASDTPIEIT